MFDSLSEKLNLSFKKLFRHGVLSEELISSTLREIKISFLEADVNYRVVNAFLRAIKKEALGTALSKSLSPGQQFIQIVNKELVKILGSTNSEIATNASQPSVIMLAGLQGAGKTTTAAKLALFLKDKKTLLTSLDVYRPAAQEQLATLAKEWDLHYTQPKEKTPLAIAKAALEQAKEEGYKHLILDTAGRLQIDEELMQELEEISQNISLQETLFVADAMTGQNAVNVTNTFHSRLALTGIILTKMDGDARGGSALSIRSITGQPIKFIGTGERPDNFEVFYPERIASRILGMGDLTSLIEKAQQHFDTQEAQKLEKKWQTNNFTLLDFKKQIQQIKKMGSLTEIVKMIPGVSQKLKPNANIDDSSFVRIEALISSMTAKEQEFPELLNSSRKQRIAKGSGTTVTDLNRLLKQFAQMKKTLQQFSNKSKKEQLRSLQSFTQNKAGNTGFPF